MTRPLSVHDRSAIRDFFYRRYKKPKVRLWTFGATDELAAGIEELSDLPIVKDLGYVGRFIRRTTRSPRLNCAAWLWLNPTEVLATDIAEVASKVGLNHKQMLPVFAVLLKAKCAEVAQSHPELRSWVQYRLPMIDVRIKLGEKDPARRAEVFQLRNALTMYDGASAEPIAGAQELLSTALLSAGQAVADAIGCGEAIVGANIMVQSTAVPTFDDLERKTNSLSASELWGGNAFSPVLVVVGSDLESGNHEGFWVPVLQYTENGSMFPGASAAIQNVPSVVICRDLPPVDQYQIAWSRYMTEEFQPHYALFASLPICLPGQSRPHAVLNLNVKQEDADGHPWHRLQHREWCSHAIDLAWDSIEIALRALLVVHKQPPAIDSGSQLHLDAMLPMKLLTAGEDDDS